LYRSLSSSKRLLEVFDLRSQTSHFLSEEMMGMLGRREKNAFNHVKKIEGGLGPTQKDDKESPITNGIEKGQYGPYGGSKISLGDYRGNDPI